MASAYIAIGSNLGARQDAIRNALARLSEVPGTLVTAVATFRETEPVDAPPDSGRFINGAAAIETDLSPVELLRRLLQIEREAGRMRAEESSIRNAPRVLDLDLLLYGDLTVADEELTLPHPRMHTRRFVLEPLAEIAPRAVHPGMGKTIAELLNELRD
jgi:2-amino-4-hydroxy-6-hydroxymethyldihydropteridine diphosphokinase